MEELTPQERTARCGWLLMEMLRTLPTASSALTLPPEEIKRREAEGHALAAELRSVARGE